MSLGSILYIEDSEAQRKSLKMALEFRDFGVEVAGDVATARSILEKRRGQIDVVALDMRLEDPQWPQMTGADVAIEYYSPQTPNSPEFLIHSAHSEVDYYKLALQLRATTYLDKSEHSQDDLIRHVRALAIRRAFDVRIPEAIDRIQRIVEESPNRLEAIVRLCHDELAPVFSGRLGTPFVFLVTEGNYTYCYANEEGFPERLDLYKTIQEMVRPGNPFIVDADRMPDSLGHEGKKVLERLNAAAFIPLTIDEDLRLSIGLLTSDPDNFPLAEPPAKMASVLAKHLTPDVTRLFLIELKEWINKHDTRRKESMKLTGGVLLSVVRNQLSILQQLNRSFPQLAENNNFRRLRNIVEDLQVAGSMLESLANADNWKESGLLSVATVNQIIESEWADLDEKIRPDLLGIHGGCELAVTAVDLSLMVSSVLQWFAQRLIHTPPWIEPHIDVHCRVSEKGAELIFEDRSARLNKMLREHLFAPFPGSIPTAVDHDSLKYNERPYSSLFLTKLLLRMRYNGILEDISDINDESGDKVEELYGHKFRMYFPNPHAGARN